MKPMTVWIGDKVAQIAPQEEMGLEEFTQELRSTEAGEELEASYLQEQTKQYREIRPEKDTLQMLQMLEELGHWKIYRL